MPYHYAQLSATIISLNKRSSFVFTSNCEKLMTDGNRNMVCVFGQETKLSNFISKCRVITQTETKAERHEDVY
ncbi:hypothetical protein CDL12_28442 [Handroanthus impetiginosus]|uniref:Uncharacterized protein n=1 Tax=Handroanthus impetiginosus TaxID=429701 RepID=A0A2G9G169_9LAMI|nr:hypothetical protein CDL12_28442 [Handroanthus impetiginosus]